MTNTPMTSREEPKMLGNVSTDELVEMGKTHPRSALTVAYSEGVIVGINKAKAQQAQTIAELVEALEKINTKVTGDAFGEWGNDSLTTSKRLLIANICGIAIAKVKGK